MKPHPVLQFRAEIEAEVEELGTDRGNGFDYCITHRTFQMKTFLE
jgi:hypothetical protein